MRDPRIPEWHGWHVARGGLSTNLFRLGVADKTIQSILRHSNVQVTQAHYIKTFYGSEVLHHLEQLEHRGLRAH